MNTEFFHASPLDYGRAAAFCESEGFMNRRKLLNRICALTVTAAMMGTMVTGAVPVYATDYANESQMEEITEIFDSMDEDVVEDDLSEDDDFSEQVTEESDEESYTFDDESDSEIDRGEVLEEDKRQ